MPSLVSSDYSHSLKKTKSKLQSKTVLVAKKQLTAKQKTAKKTAGEYVSIFSPDLSVCYITGDSGKNQKGMRVVVPHHIFGNAYKTKSEEYGFILPLRADWHTGQVYSIHEDKDLDLKFKRLCEDHYVNVLGKTKEEFIKEFGKWY